jgi:hypothetical protein
MSRSPAPRRCSSRGRPTEQRRERSSWHLFAHTSDSAAAAGRHESRARASTRGAAPSAPTSYPSSCQSGTPRRPAMAPRDRRDGASRDWRISRPTTSWCRRPAFMSARVCRFRGKPKPAGFDVAGIAARSGRQQHRYRESPKVGPRASSSTFERHPDNCSPRIHVMGADAEAAPGSATAPGRRASPSSLPALEAATLHRWVHGRHRGREARARRDRGFAI